MRIFILSLAASICFGSSGQINYTESKWINDTVFFNSGKLVLNIPEKSVERSTEYIFKGEGKSLCYPLKVSLNNDGSFRMEALMIDQIVNTTYDRIIFNTDFDVELWNTFSIDHKGSRCFMKAGNYSRIDVLPYGIVIFYEDLSPEMAVIANEIIKSINTRSSGSLDALTNQRVRRVQIIE